MLMGEIHGDDIPALNTCASDDRAATITKQKRQEAREHTAVTVVAGHRSALRSTTNQVGENSESSSPT